MHKFDVLVGTTLGGTEAVADELITVIENAGGEAKLHLTPKLSELNPDNIWLVVSATHGAGDLPENIQPFYDEIIQESSNLTPIKYALCAIGDSSYDTFCQGPEKLATALEIAGCTSCFDKIMIDVQADQIPEDAAIAWLTHWICKD